MKNCRETLDFLLAYLDGELPGDERDEFERHLRACPPCERYLDSYRATIELARGACRCEEIPEPPESLVRAILAARGRRA